jgi:hypothetical protein
MLNAEWVGPCGRIGDREISRLCGRSPPPHRWIVRSGILRQGCYVSRESRPALRSRMMIGTSVWSLRRNADQSMLNAAGPSGGAPRGNRITSATSAFLRELCGESISKAWGIIVDVLTFAVVRYVFPFSRLYVLNVTTTRGGGPARTPAFRYAQAGRALARRRLPPASFRSVVTIGGLPRLRP